MGPPTVTTVVAADQIPIAFPFSFSSMAAEISDKLPGIINTPPMPLFLPSLSPSDPPIRISDASISK